MSMLYQNVLNLCSCDNTAVKRSDKRRKSITLPASCSIYLRTITQLADKKKKRKSVKFPTTVLMQQAIMDGDVQEMKQLIGDYGSRVASECEPSGLPPVMRCVFESQLAPLRLLVEAGADLAAEDSENWTVLHVAAAMDDLDAANFVLQHCKHNLTQVRNVDGERPIDLAESTEMAKLLLHADLKTAQVETLEEEQNSESEAAILGLVQEHYHKNGNCRALDAVMKSSTCYDSLLHLAASKNYPRLASFLLRHRVGALEARDRRGWTPLHTAAYYSCVDVTLLLVQHDASVHSLANSYERASDLTTHELIRLILQEESLAL